MDAMGAEPNQDIAQLSTSQAGEIERKARVESVWQQMNKGVSEKTLKSILNKQSSNVKRTSPKPSSQNWMTVLGFGPKKTAVCLNLAAQECHPNVTQNGTNDEAKKLAAAALLAVKDAASASAATSGRGKVEVTEVRDFAGEAIEVKKLVDSDSKDLGDKGKSPVGPTSAVDAILEQIRKKPKLSVLDKTKKDWGEFKEEKGLEDELDAYKKSSNQYLDKVSFLERADYREFERERDARLAMQSKGRADMREDY